MSYGANEGNCIGHGLQASVHEIYYPRLSIYCALKLYKPSASKYGYCIDNEFEVLQKLNTSAKPKNIPYVYEKYVSERYVVLELFREKTFEEYCEYKIIDKNIIIKLVTSWLDVVKGMMYSHKHGIYHCDLNPNNLMISQSGTMIVDWSWAVQVDKNNNDRPYLLRGDYQPPEQAKNNFSKQTDVFGMGAVLLWILTGHHPRSRFFETTERRSQDRIKLILREPVHDKTTIAKILEKATAGELRHRYDNLETLHKKVKDWL